MLGSTVRHSPVGYSMIRRLRPLTLAVVGLSLAALVAAACGGVDATQTNLKTATHAPTINPSGTSTGHSSPTVSPSPGPTYPLAHVDAALEDQLPSTIGGVPLTKWSMPVSSYIASVTGGDSILYAPWLVKFGMTPDQVNMALAEDLSGNQTINLRAIKVPGIDAKALIAGLSEVATKAGWPVRTVTSLPKPVIQITDPTVDASQTANKAFVYANGDIVFFVISDDLTIVIESLAALPPMSVAS